MLPTSLLDSDDDWVESLRRKLYPKLHEPLSKVGQALGVNLYAVGDLPDRGYVGVFDEDEDTIEEEFDNRGQRNPIACFKTHTDGRMSEGSWALLHEDNAELIEEGMQLHMTLFKRSDGKSGRELHAHYEDDWRTAPFAHLRAKNFSMEKGVNIAKQYIDANSLLVLKNK